MSRRVNVRKINLSLMIGCCLALVVVIPTLISYFYTPYDPTVMKITARFQAPSLNHWLGTDQYGRDLLSRILVGGQTSLSIAAVAVVIGLIIGVSLGALAGYFGKWWDEVLMRIAEVLYSFPNILLALLAVTIFGAGKRTIMAAITIANIPTFMKITRANFLKLRQYAFVEAARSVGASDLRIMIYHILPNSLRPILVQASASFGSAILAEASLSYLGVGVQPPEPSWGWMLKEAQSFAGLAPWTVIYPGIAIVLIVLGMNLITDGLRTKGEMQF